MDSKLNHRSAELSAFCCLSIDLILVGSEVVLYHQFVSILPFMPCLLGYEWYVAFALQVSVLAAEFDM